MNLAIMALYATLVIDGTAYHGTAPAHTYYDEGPSGSPELHIKASIGFKCKHLPEVSRRETRVFLNRQEFSAVIVDYMPRLNIWIIETRHGNVECARYRTQQF